MSTLCVQIAVNRPLYRVFDYLPKDNETPLQPGMRVKVPFGRQQITGMIIACAQPSLLPPTQLKTITEILDPLPLLNQQQLALCRWLADYYHHPVGEVLFHTLPRTLRQGAVATLMSKTFYTLSASGQEATVPKRSPKLASLLELLRQQTTCSQEICQKVGITKATINNALKKSWIVAHTETCQLEKTAPTEQPLALNSEQTTVLTQLKSKLGSFCTHLLHGVTGSGKTEVYLQLIDEVLQQGQQVLVLIPEIALTPQTVKRFAARLAHPHVVLHSNLTDKARTQAWLHSRASNACVIIGTRSAVFTPAPNLGLIIIDEEHDASFKQQEGLRYHARDVALMRAKQLDIPVLLGTATPSIESFANTSLGRFDYLQLGSRATGAAMPQFQVLDVREQHLSAGLSDALLEQMQIHLLRGEQVLLFLNRRGFAPVLLCHDCAWVAPCSECDARMVYHAHPPQLHCHHCAKRQACPTACPDCGSTQLVTLGLGTQRVEELLLQRFPDTDIIRIDKDSSRHRGALTKLLEQVQNKRPQILIGTQMLAKGHHFPNVTLVGILDIDHGFYSCDLRASERMGQLILQVAGRAGREQKPGTVLLQTHFPQHPLLQQLLQQGYRTFLQTLLAEREAAGFPPFSYQALVRAEANDESRALLLLKQLKQQLKPHCQATLVILGPVAAIMQRKAGMFRAQLLLQAKTRKILHHGLSLVVNILNDDKTRTRWSIDVDPQDFA